MDFFKERIGTISGILIIGLTIRLCLSPFFGDHSDMSYWTSILLDIKNGDGLYTQYDNWYPPVWGYVLSLTLPLFDLFNISPMMRLDESISYIGLGTGDGWIPSVGAMFILKLPLIVADAINCWLIYKIVKRLTDDERKSVYSAALWMFNPLTIWVSSMCGQFEPVCLLFTLLMLYSYLEKSYLFCGIAASAAVLTKVTPAFVLVPLMALVLFREKDIRTSSKNLIVMCAGGIVTTLLILMPQIINGEMEFVLSFLTRLTGSYPVPYGYAPASAYSMALIPEGGIGYGGRLIPTVLVTFIIAAYIFVKKRFSDWGAVLIAAGSLSVSLLWLPAPGYTCYAVPIIGMLCVCSSYDKKYSVMIWVLTILCFVSVMSLYRESYNLAELGICDINTISEVSDKISSFFSPINQKINSLKFIPVAAGTVLSLMYSRRETREE